MQTADLKISRQQANRTRIAATIRTAAIAAFDQCGFRGTTTQDIAARAGLSKPQLHYYISSKQELYQELLHDVLNSWSADVIFDPDGDPGYILREYIRQKTRHALQHPALSRIFTRELMDGGPNLGTYWPRALASIQQKVAILAHWIEVGKLPSMNPNLLLIHIWALTQHYADYEIQVRLMLGLSPEEPIDDEPIVQAVTDMVLRCCDLVHPAPLAAGKPQATGA
ncbi:TetR family transcriptional regulator C-terminal domain-containing protein [Kerstersia similis]|uniref:TetR family transcriptional regulator C-terminal domain-containing protein n=1 Tax=Kerstersia similis TaxID=206505 RepID=UPI0039EE1979